MKSSIPFLCAPLLAAAICAGLASPLHAGQTVDVATAIGSTVPTGSFPQLINGENQQF